MTKTYTNGEVTVVWKPDVCIHSAICFKGLPGVFDPRKRPWISTDGGTTNEIIEQVKKCPSGAISFFMNDQKSEIKINELENLVEIMPSGPVLVHGNIRIKKQDGTEEQKTKVTAFCRCGGSSNKPFCDGTHRKIGFEG